MEPPKNSPPKFPDWKQVLHRLYTTEAFVACGMDPKSDPESLPYYLKQRKEFEDKYDFPVSGADLIAHSIEMASRRNLALSAVSEEEILKKYNALTEHRNQFTLVGLTTKPDFLRVSKNAKHLLGLAHESEINLPRICGLDPSFEPELHHPLDVQHAVRLGLSAIFVTTIKGVVIHPFADFYEISFRLGYKTPERQKTVLRICHLSNQEGEEPGARHLDLWRVDRGQNDTDHVRAKIETKEPGPMREVIQCLFFATNCFLLKLDPRDVVLANLLSKYHVHQYPKVMNQKCADALNQNGLYYTNPDCATLSRNLNRKVNSRILDNTVGAEYRTMVEKKNALWKYGQLGILSLPSLLEKSIWAEVEHELD